MKFPVYSVRDVKVGFMAPRLNQNDAAMIRDFSFDINNRDGVMNFSPKDFDLYRIGMFDSDTGKIEDSLPALVVNGESVFGVKDA